MFKTSRMVEFHDTDMAGIMHFASFFHYMESAEHELIRSLGYSVHLEVDGQTFSYPRVHASCDYKSPARCEEILDIEIVVARLGRSSVTYDFRFSHEGREVARGEMTSVCCLLTTDGPMKVAPIPSAAREKLQAYVV